MAGSLLSGSRLATPHDDHALHGAIALAAGLEFFIVLQHEVHHPAVIRAQRPRGLGLARGAHLLRKGDGKLTQLFVLTLAVVAGIKLHTNGSTDAAGHNARGQILQRGKGLPFAPDEQTGIFATVNGNLDATIGKVYRKRGFADDGTHKAVCHFKADGAYQFLIKVFERDFGQPLGGSFITVIVEGGFAKVFKAWHLYFVFFGAGFGTFAVGAVATTPATSAAAGTLGAFAAIFGVATFCGGFGFTFGTQRCFGRAWSALTARAVSPAGAFARCLGTIALARSGLPFGGLVAAGTVIAAAFLTGAVVTVAVSARLAVATSATFAPLTGFTPFAGLTPGFLTSAFTLFTRLTRFTGLTRGLILTSLSGLARFAGFVVTGGAFIAAGPRLTGGLFAGFAYNVLHTAGKLHAPCADLGLASAYQSEDAGFGILYDVYFKLLAGGIKVGARFAYGVVQGFPLKLLVTVHAGTSAVGGTR